MNNDCAHTSIGVDLKEDAFVVSFDNAATSGSSDHSASSTPLTAAPHHGTKKQRKKLKNKLKRKQRRSQLAMQETTTFEPSADWLDQELLQTETELHSQQRQEWETKEREFQIVFQREEEERRRREE